jgi:uncharacterized membrane protein YphA (DoxX/SURF4 family)
LRRLFSTFAHGWPGVGLLLIRLAVGVTLIERAVMRLWSGPTSGPTILLAVLSVMTAIAGLFLLAGLWTPIAGTLVAVVEVWKIFLHVGDPWIYILLATLGGALVLLGPGAWSVDARLFGWKRLEIRPRKSQL